MTDYGIMKAIIEKYDTYEGTRMRKFDEDYEESPKQRLDRFDTAYESLAHEIAAFIEGSPFDGYENQPQSMWLATTDIYGDRWAGDRNDGRLDVMRTLYDESTDINRRLENIKGSLSELLADINVMRSRIP